MSLQKVRCEIRASCFGQLTYFATELSYRLLFGVLSSCRASSSEIGVAATRLAHRKSVRVENRNILAVQ